MGDLIEGQNEDEISDEQAKELMYNRLSRVPGASQIISQRLKFFAPPLRPILEEVCLKKKTAMRGVSRDEVNGFYKVFGLGSFFKSRRRRDFNLLVEIFNDLSFCTLEKPLLEKYHGIREIEKVIPRCVQLNRDLIEHSLRHIEAWVESTLRAEDDTDQQLIDQIKPEFREIKQILFLITRKLPRPRLSTELS